VRLWHGPGLAAVAVSPDGKLVASGSGTHGERAEIRVRLWDTATGRPVRDIGTPRRGVHCLQFSPDGGSLAAGCGGIVHVWDVGTGQELHRFSSGAVGILWVQFCDRGRTLAAGVERGAIYLWDLATAKRLRKWRPWLGPSTKPARNGAPSRAYASALSSDGRMLACVADADHRPEGAGQPALARRSVLLLRDAATGREVRRIALDGDSSHVLAWSANNRLLACGEHEVEVWEAAAGKRLHLLRQAVRATIVALAFSPDGRWLAAADCVDSIELWDMKTGTRRHRLPSFSVGVRTRDASVPLAFSPDGKLLVSCGEATVRLWDVASGREYPAGLGHRSPVGEVRFSADGGTVTLLAEGVVCDWDTVAWNELRRVRLYPSLQERRPDRQGELLLGISLAGNKVCLKQVGGRLRLEEGTTGKLLRTLDVDKGEGQGGLFSEDGKLLWLFRHGTASEFAGPVIDVATGKRLGRFQMSADDGVPVFSPDGRLLASPTDTGDAKLIMVASGKVIMRLDHGADAFNPDERLDNATALFSADGRRLAVVVTHLSRMSGGQDTRVTVWDVTSGRVVQCLRLASSIRFRRPSVALSADGRTVAAGDPSEPTVHLWEVASGRERAGFRGHRAPVRALHFSASGRWLASGSEDNTVLVWDVAGAVRTEATPQADLTAARLNELWGDLADPDAVRAYVAIRTLIRAPRQAVPFLRGRLRPPAVPGRERLAGLMTDLDSRRFAVRERAMHELKKLGDAAEPALR
jgi:WD40 repeat protein